MPQQLQLGQAETRSFKQFDDPLLLSQTITKSWIRTGAAGTQAGAHIGMPTLQAAVLPNTTMLAQILKIFIFN